MTKVRMKAEELLTGWEYPTFVDRRGAVWRFTDYRQNGSDFVWFGLVREGAVVGVPEGDLKSWLTCLASIQARRLYHVKRLAWDPRSCLLSSPRNSHSELEMLKAKPRDLIVWLDACFKRAMLLGPKAHRGSSD